MAEVPEYDPFSLGKEDNPDDFDDDTDLRLGRKPSETPVRITSTTRDEDEDEETNEKTPLIGKEKELAEARAEMKKVRPDANLKRIVPFFHPTKGGIEFLAIEGQKGGIYVYLGNEDDFYRYDKKTGKIGRKLPPGKLRDDLGRTKAEIVERRNLEVDTKKEKQNEREERKKFLENKPNKTPEERTELENLGPEIEESQEDRANDVYEIERIEETMPLRDRLKYLFKKYGFTVFAVMSAVGVIIGVIVSNLSKGLSALGRGVGKGLKTIGKKLGEILPGMVGAIVSFLFKTAGEVIGFLGKNAWLLIMAVVLYFVESIKKKSK